MSKELVISTNRHETKVAILEDDQLVEVYFQRANEYSLAGSIHKGRVTRVLPGMQSAFVDLGLERDTFLYVSDFFEENADEYDTPPPAEVRGGGRRGDRRDEPPPHLPRVMAVEAPAAVVEEPKIEAGASASASSGSRRAWRHAGDRVEEAGQADRRGRRSRRRRGRGRGFPDSKYASDVATAAGPSPNRTKNRSAPKPRLPKT